MLDSIKRQGVYRDIQYEHAGPVHLSIGQESTAVGQCVHLDLNDFTFGSHRSHGEILAKCLSAVEKTDDTAIDTIMRNFLGGACLSAVEKDHTGNLKDLAEDFVLYGTLAEIFGRSTGFNRGLGGSMHAFFTPFGCYPNNAIVGGSGDISVGAALYKRINKKPGIVIANIGDAAAACGPVWEGLMLAAMDQYRSLWDKEMGGAPPVLINLINNFYGMGGQTAGETMGFEVLARLGAGVNPENMHSERVDGYNPLAVADTIEKKKALLLAGKGPVLLDTITYRLSGHGPSDVSTYRTKEEVALWEQSDCIETYWKYLAENGVISESEKEDYKTAAAEKITKALKLASSRDISPRVDPLIIESLMFSNRQVDRFDEGEPDVLTSESENPRVKSIRRKARFGLGKDGRPLPKAKTLNIRDALFEAMLYRFYRDPTMVAYGEENRDWGGAFAVYRGLTESLPYHRLFNTPISEGAIVGSAIGYAMCGGRAVVELMYCDFMGRAGDQIFNQASKWQAMSAGVLQMPVTVRVSVGDQYGAQHSQDWTSLVGHIPGLKVMFPATPYDAKGMLNLALHGTDPVIFFESQRIYDMGEIFVRGGVPEDYYEVPLGEPATRREGNDLTICTIGAPLYRALEAAEDLETMGISAEVIDLRFITPLNLEPIRESVRKTGKVVLVSDACERGSFLHTVASIITQSTFDFLDGPVATVGARNWITPPAELESSFFPQKEWILDTIHERIFPLKGHTPSTVQTGVDLIRRYKEGI
jgi:2-oxoisovalerate dehydrogenase E1 component